MNIVVAGGGIIGIAAAILLKKNNNKVYIVEKSNRLGGLLNSVAMKDGTNLDFGSHVPRETGIAKLDEILFASLPLEKWNKYNYANVGNYFAGHLNTDSQFIDASQLQPSEYVNGIKDLLNIEHKQTNFDDGLKSLHGQFGVTFSEIIYKPLLKKLFGDIQLQKLMPNSHNLFGYNRLILGNQSFTEKLKTVDYLDYRIAHTKNSIGFSLKSNYYPKLPGIFQWVEHLESQAIKLGVSIINEDSVEKIHIESKNLQLHSGENLSYDKLIWTLPNGLLKVALEEKDSFEVQHFRGVNLIHFKYEGVLMSQNHYVYCNDPTMKTFRVTIYDNLTQNKTNWCTVEVIGDKVSEIQLIFDELIKMQILNKDAKCVQSEAIYVTNGFPVPLMKEQKSYENLPNIIILNKDANNFFMEDLLIKMYNNLQAENLI